MGVKKPNLWQSAQWRNFIKILRGEVKLEPFFPIQVKIRMKIKKIREGGKIFGQCEVRKQFLLWFIIRQKLERNKNVYH